MSGDFLRISFLPNLLRGEMRPSTQTWNQLYGIEIVLPVTIRNMCSYTLAFAFL